MSIRDQEKLKEFIRKLSVVAPVDYIGRAKTAAALEALRQQEQEMRKQAVQQQTPQIVQPLGKPYQTLRDNVPLGTATTMAQQTYATTYTQYGTATVNNPMVQVTSSGALLASPIAQYFEAPWQCFIDRTASYNHTYRIMLALTLQRTELCINGKRYEAYAPIGTPLDTRNAVILQGDKAISERVVMSRKAHDLYSIIVSTVEDIADEIVNGLEDFYEALHWEIVQDED